MNDPLLHLLVSVVGFATFSYLTIRIAALLWGAAEHHPRLLAAFELKRQPARVEHPALSVDFWVLTFILLIIEFAVTLQFVEVLARGDPAGVTVIGAHYAMAAVWIAYLRKAYRRTSR